MKKYLYKILLLFLPVVLLLYPLDRFLSSNLRNSNSFAGEIEVWNDIFDGKIDADMAIYGASIAWTAFDTKILEDSLKINAYNFGIDGHPFRMQYLRHREYLKYNEPPSKIILAISAVSLQKGKNTYNCEQFIPYMLWNEDIMNNFTIEAFDATDYYVPLIRYFGRLGAIKSAILGLLSDKPEKFRYKGFHGQDLPWDTNWRRKLKRRKPYSSEEIDHETFVLLKKFIEECKTSNIELILVWPPQYAGGWKYMVNREKYIDIYNSLAEEYNLTYLDYSVDSMCADTALFYNATHLNGTGAAIFTRKLIKDIKILRQTK
jgi:hypothetical protein